MRVTIRPLWVLAVMGLLTTSGVAAHATPAPCNLVMDVRGDGNDYGLLRAPINDPVMDIVSADVASDGSHVTGVIRLVDVTPAGTDTQSTPRWTLSFDVGKVRYFMRANPFRGKIVSQSGVIEPGTGAERDLQTISAVLDTARHEVRITAPVRDFALLTDLRPGTVLRSLQVQTVRVNDFGLGRIESAPRDQATGKNYTAGTRSCVRVER